MNVYMGNYSYTVLYKGRQFKNITLDILDLRETRTSGHLSFAKNEVGCHEGELVPPVHSLGVDQPGSALSRLTLQVLQADRAGSKSNHVKESIPLTLNPTVGGM